MYYIIKFDQQSLDRFSMWSSRDKSLCTPDLNKHNNNLLRLMSTKSSTRTSSQSKRRFSHDAATNINTI